MTDAECRALRPGDRVRNTHAASPHYDLLATVVAPSTNHGQSVVIRYDGGHGTRDTFAWALERAEPVLDAHSAALLAAFTGGAA